MKKIIIILISLISINAIAQDKTKKNDNVIYYSYDDDIEIIEKTNKRGYVKKLIIVRKDGSQQNIENVENYKTYNSKVNTTTKPKKEKNKTKLQLGKRVANATVSLLLGTSAIIMQDIYRMRASN
jgi:hypothetical protein